MQPVGNRITDWVYALLLWLWFAAALGLYYATTYFADTRWPLPSPECLLSITLYYFSVVDTDTDIQSIHWMVTVVVSGLLWVGVLGITAPYFEGRRAIFSYAALRFSLATLPLSLAAPWLAYFAGSSDSGFSFRQLLDVALRREMIAPPPWLDYLFVGLACVALLIQLAVYRAAFEVPAKKAWMHLLSSALMAALLAVGLGTAVAFPLRAWLE